MPERTDEINAGIVSRYTDQPPRMPEDVRATIERAWDGSPVQLYALADLDESMRLSRIWVALGSEAVAIVKERTEGEHAVRSFDRSKISGVRTRPGISCTATTFLGTEDELALAVLRYTHRQRRAVENIQFLVEQELAGRQVSVGDADAVYADALARPIRDAQAATKVNKTAVIWRLVGYLAPYKARVVAGSVAATLITALSLLPPYLMKYLIDDVFTPFQDGVLPGPPAERLAWITVAVLAGALLFRQVSVWLRLRLMSVLGELVARDLRNQVYEHLQKLSLNYYSRMKTGSIISRVTSDTDRLWHFIAFGIIEMSLAFVTIAGLGGVLLWMDWQLGLVMVLPVPVLFWCLVRYSSKMSRIFLRAWRKWSALTGLVADTVGGVRVVKAFNQEVAERGRFDDRNRDVTGEFNRIHAVWTTFWPLLMGSIRMLMVVVWVLAVPRLLDRGPAGLSAGTFFAYILYMQMFLAPMEIIGQMTHMVNRATSSAHRLFEVLDTEPEVADRPDPVVLEPVEGRVTFEEVTFAYDGVRQIIKGISLDVHPGEMIGLVGPSGAGKTTIINLIVRFYDASGGRVLIDGVDVRDLEKGHFRRQVGMVLQDPYLFHGTILENIRYGVPDADVDRVVLAARAANAHDFICKLPHGYDTMVGERGHTLSGGERQRISIARAILNDPRILILDEATSSVDTETEGKIQEALDRLIPGRTVFAIAHRLSTLKRANRLFVIEEGRVTEQGTHAELLAKPDGTYRKFYEMQQQLHEQYVV